MERKPSYDPARLKPEERRAMILVAAGVMVISLSGLPIALFTNALYGDSLSPWPTPTPAHEIQLEDDEISGLNIH